VLVWSTKKPNSSSSFVLQPIRPSGPLTYPSSDTFIRNTTLAMD
jgi:hypothetical protein